MLTFRKFVANLLTAGLMITGFAMQKASAEPAVHVKKVAVISYNPTNPNNPGQRLSHVLNWPSITSIANELVDTFSNATNGRVQYQIVENHQLNKFPQRLDGTSWNWNGYMDCVNSGYNDSLCKPSGQDTAKYLPLITSDTGANLCTKIATGQIDEIWLWGSYYFGFDEFAYRIPNDATMYQPIPYNYWLYDGRKYDLPQCGRTYFVMGWIPQAGMANTVHSYGHRIESALSLSPAGKGLFNTCTEPQAGSNEWTQFLCIEKTQPGQAMCGNIHYPPNGQSDYDYTNMTSVQSGCDDWFNNYPNPTGAKAAVNAQTWAQPDGDYHLGFMKWWLRHIPRFNGSHTDVANDWWYYILNYENPNDTPISSYPTMHMRGTHNNWSGSAMQLIGNYTWQLDVAFGSTANERFKFDVTGNWSINFGDTNRDNLAEQNGSDILITQGAGTYRVIFNDQTRAYSVTKQGGNNSDIRRTVIFMYGQTVVGQDMFLRGGIDWTYARNNLGRDCAVNQWLCAIPITHNLFPNDPNRSNDKHLDWYGAETGQNSSIQGSPLVWTTNNANNPKKVAIDGYGYTPLNTWGDHYWMLDVQMDCSKGVKIGNDTWIELKSYISNGPGWENNVSQPGAPYASANHFAKCGWLNKFERGSSAVYFETLP
jgi:hypothetical protein